METTICFRARRGTRIDGLFNSVRRGQDTHSEQSQHEHGRNMQGNLSLFKASPCCSPDSPDISGPDPRKLYFILSSSG